MSFLTLLAFQLYLWILCAQEIHHISIPLSLHCSFLNTHTNTHTHTHTIAEDDDSVSVCALEVCFLLLQRGSGLSVCGQRSAVDLLIRKSISLFLSLCVCVCVCVCTCACACVWCMCVCVPSARPTRAIPRSHLCNV